MSATEEAVISSSEDQPRGIGRPGKDLTLEYMTDAREMVLLLNRTQMLTDEAFNELVDDIGARAARLVLRAKALHGDVRALDLYLRIAREDADKRRERGKPATRSVHTSGFVQSGRTQAQPASQPATTDDVESPTPVVIDPLQK